MPTAVTLPASQIPTSPPDLSQKLPKLIPRRRPQADQTTSNPAPPTPPLPELPNLDGITFTPPTRRILSPHDHDLFLKSDTHSLIVSFIFTLSDSVRNTTISTVSSSPAAQHPTILTILSILTSANDLLKSHPPLDTGSRFGNPAFRDYLSAITALLPTWHADLSISPSSAAPELSTYLAQSFGNGSRIDYGSGHELNFLLWLLCLRQLGALPASTFPALALLIFPRYIALMREVQITYYLEPAGSHGVWGLDDYQFAPFLLGASQLVDHRHLRPMSIHQAAVVEECAREFLYFDQVRWVNATKTVQGLRWHSPMLDDISAAKSWGKVEAGMRRMFLAEVLGKLPVAQHFLFGALLPAAEGMGGGEEEEEGVEGGRGEGKGEDGEVEVTVDGMRHVHVANSWGDCCGIKVPSAIAARQEERKAGDGRELRRLPFD